MQPTDSALLRDYAENRSDDAFAALVSRHVDLVYSVAWRRVGNTAWAEEISQAVFIILARKAGQLRSEKALSSWLFQTTRLTAGNFLRGEIRRRHREQEACMQTILEGPEPELWPQIAPLLDAAVSALNEKDRRAVLLRFYEGKSLADVGVLMGASEAAAEKRVSRAMEKLQGFFSRRGVNSTAEALTKTVAAHSVQAAPAVLAATATGLALAKGATASASTAALIKGTLKAIAWANAKMAAAAGLAGLLIIGTATTIKIAARLTDKDPRPYDAWDQISNLTHQVSEVSRLQSAKTAQQRRPMSAAEMKKNSAEITALYTNFFKKAPAGVIIRPTHFPDRRGWLAQSGNGMIIGTAVPLAQLVSIAFGANNDFSIARIVLPPDAPSGDFDYLVNVPDRGRELFQAEIQKQFGLIGHFEVRETNALVLRVKDRSALRRFDSPQPDHDPQAGYSTPSATPDMAPRLEKDYLHQPVIDGTGLAKEWEESMEAHYWFILPWQQDDVELLKEDLGQSGFELGTTNLPIQMLVVNAYPGDWIWDFDSTSLAKVPPLLILQPTTHGSWVPSEMFGGANRYLATGKTPKELIASVYSQIDSRAKITFQADLPDDKYDCIVSVPSTNWWSALRSEVNRRFNITEDFQSGPDGSTVVVRKAP